MSKLCCLLVLFLVPCFVGAAMSCPSWNYQLRIRDSDVVCGCKAMALRLRGGNTDNPSLNAMYRVWEEESGSDPVEEARIKALIEEADEHDMRREGKDGPVAVPSPPLLPKQLHNRYFAMRHGESEANMAGLIVSSPDNGADAYGLTPHGVTQARASAEAFAAWLDTQQEDGKSYGPGPESADGERGVVVFTSQFKRARETADELVKVLDWRCKGEQHVHEALRERFFGALELGNHSRYHDVWAFDAKDPNHHQFGVESVVEVAERTANLIRGIEESLTHKDVILVSHGDALQITQALVAGMPLSQHRSLKHLEQAEIRQLLRV